jgi:DNA-binding transcriptional LysR family regulator
MSLRVGCLLDLPLQRLQAFVGAVYAHIPNSTADVVHAPAREQFRALRAGALDLGIVHGERDESGIAADPLFRGEPLDVFLPVDGRGPCEVGPAELEARTLILPPRAADASLHDALLTRFHEAGYRFSDIRETSGSHVRDTLLAVSQGYGFTVAPRSTLEVIGQANTIVTLGLLSPAVTMPDTVLVSASGSSDGMVAVARELAADLYDSVR